MAETCKRCGGCCLCNGLIPPFREGADADAPEWFKTMVRNLRFYVGRIAENHACIFLRPDGQCAIHDEPWLPAVCREFEPGDCPGYRKEASGG